MSATDPAFESSADPAEAAPEPSTSAEVRLHPPAGEPLDGLLHYASSGALSASFTPGPPPDCELEAGTAVPLEIRFGDLIDPVQAVGRIAYVHPLPGGARYGLLVEDAVARQQLEPWIRRWNQDRRGSARVSPPEDKPIEVLFEPDGNGAAIRGWLVDVSTTGLAFKQVLGPEDGYLDGQSGTCVFRLPGIEPVLEMRAHVRNLRPIGRSCYIGMQFERREESREARALIAEYVDRRLEDLTGEPTSSSATGEEAEGAPAPPADAA